VRACTSSCQIASYLFILVRTDLKQWKIFNKVSSGRYIDFPHQAPAKEIGHLDNKAHITGPRPDGVDETGFKPTKDIFKWAK